MAEAKEEKVKQPSEFAQHMKAAGEAIANQWGSLIPDEFWTHRRKARREMLLAMRTVVDSAIKRLEGNDDDAPKPKSTTRRKTKVEVEE